MSVMHLTGLKELDSLFWMAETLSDTSCNFDELHLTSEFGGYLVINSSHLLSLIALMTHLRTVRLKCWNVNFQAIIPGKGNINFITCPGLKAIELIDCRNTVRLISQAVCDCPLLESVNTKAVHMNYPENFNAQCLIIAQNLNHNCRLRDFELCEMTDFFIYSGAWPSKNQIVHDEVVKYDGFITSVIERNVIGWEKCRDAIYQLYLIKRYGASPLFLCLNRDVVKIIARLLYQSRFTQVWCPLLELP